MKLTSTNKKWPFVILVWPALSLVIAIVLWSATVYRANTELKNAETFAIAGARSYAEEYSQYITRSVGQMDQVTMQLQYEWEHSKGTLKLQDLKKEGMFTDPAFVTVSIVDRDGIIRTSTRNWASAPALGNTDFFRFHKNNNSSALRIDAPTKELASKEHVVLFTRRLDTADDEFDGLVMLTIDADYFTAFYSPRVLGQEGVLAMFGADNNLRLVSGDTDIVSKNSPLHDSSELGSSIFDATDGVKLMYGKKALSDKLDRILAWNKSSGYPLVALVGLSRNEVLATAEENGRRYRYNAVLATLGLILVAGLATALSGRRVARKQEQDEVRRAYRTATEGANDGFYMVYAMRDSAGQITDFEFVDCNERGASFYDMSRSEFLGTRLSVLETTFGISLIPTYKIAMETGFHEEDVSMPRDHRLGLTWGHRRIVRTSNGLAVTLQDISERKAYENQLLNLVNIDSLTGLPNRYWTNHFLPTALTQAKEKGVLVALLFIDLDEFKHINDTQGHTVGDELLKISATRLKSLLRPSDHVVRFGGDEFIVILNPVESDQQVSGVAERIVNAFAAPFSIGNEMQAVGASVGISVFPRDGEDPETLIKHGDIAMYSGKSEGKGQFRFYERSLSEKLENRELSKRKLMDAINKDQLALYFQPRVDALTGELCSMEALVRWIHPEHGLIPPAEFIPLAESTRLILQIGEIVMEKACAQLHAWRAEGLPIVPVSINVSPLQFERGNVHRQLAIYLKKYDIPPQFLEVEITESAMIGDQVEIVAELSAIRDLGVKLHIDDFGTGYSSLSQLQKLKMDVLKVDKAFTSELGNSKEGEVFFQAIVSMAHALGMSVVAEGVETREQLDILQTLACDEVQGYWIDRPMPARDVAAMIKRRFLFPEIDASVCAVCEVEA